VLKFPDRDTCFCVKSMFLMILRVFVGFGLFCGIFMIFMYWEYLVLLCSFVIFCKKLLTL
jgi:hypothetical protein